ncbi:MAG: glycosyl hydrolase [Vicinamibacteria bacterium]|nr:glycosyl hydrolase [Vicinamibacteria bacterium]
MSARPTLLAAALACASALAAGAQDVKVDADLFGGLEARPIGPAAMSGRISSLDVVPGDKLTVYVGSAAGGVFKSVDGGLTFKPVSDKHAMAIGALRVDPKEPKTVWIGTGEPWVRNSVSGGDGVYKSTDGGDNWTRVGLEHTERIAKIEISPQSSDTVFVCALGHLFDDHPDRGVYRTKDGGKTWEKTLSVADDTGCADLVVDPQDGRIVYAAMWQFRRSADFFTSGGPKSGLYKSTDGGTTWREITKGLPEGDLGRIAIAVSPVRPAVVYATVEARTSGFYRSDDLGESWTLQSQAAVTGNRPFYFSHLVADPKHLDRVYKGGTLMAVTDDAGKTWTSLGGSYHPDVHAIWVHPSNPETLLIGTDGGLYHTWNRGNRWLFVGTLPLSQFYHVSYDMAFPYNVYGGMQDNSSWWGPTRKGGGILNKHWDSLLGGDGFWVLVDPKDEDVVYAEYQGGNVFRIDKRTGEMKDIKPSPRKGEPKFRFNWNAPMHISRNTGALYFGAQMLFRTTDRGESWERLSGDLTTNDPKKQRQKQSGGLTIDNSTAENHTTIYTIAESPKDANVIWVGTDDGNLQVTRDGGKTWTNVAPNVPDVPKGTWVSEVEASPHDAATAFATFDGHWSGDTRPWVFRTTDYGKTWTSLVTADLKGFAHVVRQDLVNPELLFLGTDTGLFVSLDGGKAWAAFNAGLPITPVHDLQVHPREGDLIVGTHGRGIYILDDLTPLRALTPAMLNADAAVLPSRAGVRLIPGSLLSGGDANGDNEYAGRSVGEVAWITYYLKKRHIVGDLKVEVYDPAGKLLSTIPGGKRRGLNRVEWSMRPLPPKFAPGAGIIFAGGAFFGPRVPEGEYTVKLIRNKDVYESKVTLVPDPRVSYPEADRKLQQETVWKLFADVERLTHLVAEITHVRDQARAAAATLKAGDAKRRKLDALAASMEAQRVALVATQEGEGISGEEKLREELGVLYGNVNGNEGRPTQSQLDRREALLAELDAARARFEAEAKSLVALGLTRLSEEEWRKTAK